MKRSKSEWSSIFLKTIGASESFQVELNRQLTAQFLESVQINLQEENFSLAPVDMVFHEHNTPGVVFMECDLVFPDFFAYPVKIAWRCANDVEKRIDFKNTIDDDCKIEIFWLELPMQELLAYKNEKSKKSSQAPAYGWPDVHFKIHTQEESTEKFKEELEKYIRSWIETYNSENNQSQIDYSGKLIWEGAQITEIHIDFGEAGTDVLSQFIANLSTFQNVQKITYI